MRNRTMVGAVILGLIIGTSQFFYVTTKTIQSNPKPAKIMRDSICHALSPECGYCSGRTVGELCYHNPYTYKQKFRGFPLSNGSYGFDSRTDVNRKLFINLAIFVIGLPVLVALFKRFSKLKHRNKH